MKDHIGYASTHHEQLSASEDGHQGVALSHRYRVLLIFMIPLGQLSRHFRTGVDGSVKHEITKAAVPGTRLNPILALIPPIR